MKPSHTAPRILTRWGLLSALVAACPFVGAQVAPTASAPTSTPTATKPASAVPTESGDDVLVMTPFEVSSESQHGYQATSTLSGTRLNTNLDDLAASISVVTKQQLEDTAAVDINDVFKNELNTEGTFQYTDISVSSQGIVSDNTGNNPASANRVRGLTGANMAMDGFGSSLPVDTYNIDAVEISRGPNSNIFGLGNAGGSVNLVGSKANLQRDSNRFTTRGDSFDGYRETFDINRTLIRGKLAARVMGMYENKGYKLKPSKDTTRRLEFAVTAAPTQNTTINASFESYRNYNSRPNSITPRDMKSDWIASGSPTWDPTTSTAHLANGTSLTYAQLSANRTAYYGLNLTDSAFANVPNMYIDGGQIQMYQIGRMPTATTTGPTNTSGSQYLLQNGNNYTANTGIYPLFTPRSVSDKSVYDWSSINLTAPNYQSTKGETSNISVNQFILRTPRQTLAAQGSWRYQRTAGYDRRFLGTSATTAAYIDVNEKLLDGSTNPYFMRTYVGGSAPSFSRTLSQAEQYRFTLAYDLDLSREKSWLKWFGRNRFTGLAEYQQILSASLKYNDTNTSTSAWMAGTTSRNNSPWRAYTRFYVGDTNNQNVDYAPQGIPNTPYTTKLKYYNGVTAQWLTEDARFDEYYDGGQYSRRLLNTYQGNWQGWYLNGRIIPMVGVTRALNRTRSGNAAINPTAATDGYFDTSPMKTYGSYDWVQHHGTTKTAGIVIKPLSWLGLTYNQSDSFSPGSTAYDVQGNALPDPSGKTKDYGFDLTLLRDRSGNERLSVRARQYETTSRGRGTDDLNTIVQRVIRMEWRSSSGDPGLGSYYLKQLQETLHPDWTTDQAYAEIKRISGIDMAYTRGHLNKTHGDNSDSVSRGQEVEMTLNPTRYWTARINAARSVPLNGSMSPETLNYITERMAVWTTARSLIPDETKAVTDPNRYPLWWTTAADNNTVASDWFTQNVDARLKLATALQGKRRAQTREYRVAMVNSYNLAGLSDNKILKSFVVGGTVRWEAKGAIGYLGAAPTTVGGVTAIREYDANRPVWDTDQYYYDAMIRYKTKLFRDRVGCSVQLNVDNIFEGGRLQAVAINPDGQAWAYRIIDPRKFSLTVSFDL